MKATLFVDDAVGEMRRCLVDQAGRPFRLELDRWSERGRRARLGEKRWGRARARLGDDSWFVDIGVGPDGVVEVRKSDRVTEGKLIAVVVAAEAYADKGPRLRRLEAAGRASKGQEPGLIARPETDELTAGVDLVATASGLEARETIDAAIEEALQIVTAIPGGGDFSIESTRGLTAIDVDSRSRAIAGQSDVYAFNRLAGREIARQIGLRALGGLIVVDFMNLRSFEDNQRLSNSFRSSIHDLASSGANVGQISPFGLCELIMPRRVRALTDVYIASPGERGGLDAIRMIETVAKANAGRRIRARAPAAASAWLNSGAIDWEFPLADRIGHRWTIEAGVEPRGSVPDVWAES